MNDDLHDEGRVTSQLPRVPTTSQMPSPYASASPRPEPAGAGRPKPFWWEGRWWLRDAGGLFWYDVATETWVLYGSPQPARPSPGPQGVVPGRRAAWAEPAPAPRGWSHTPPQVARSPEARRRGFRPRWLTLAAVAGIVIGALLPWVSPSLGSANSFDVPVEALLSAGFAAQGSSLGAGLLGLAAVAALLSFVPFMGLVRSLCGLIGTAVVVVFGFQLLGAVDGGLSLETLTDSLGVGPYVTLVSSLVLSAAR